jgi:tape measure domain-containing protein
LLARNVISTKQYADQVAHLNRQIDSTPRPANTNVPAAAPSSLGALRTGAAALGVTVSASALTGMADEYTNITNRLRLMAPDQAKANALFEQLHGVANRTRSELGATVDAFAGMSRATKALGLSQDETVRLTETLNKLVTVSGKSATESAAGLMQFSQALSSGRLQGDELRSVFENMPSLVDALMKSLGKTQAELREMGSQGLITSKVMVTALQQAAAGVDASMGKTIPTLAQSWVVFKNDMMVAVGEMNQSLGITSALGSAMGALGMAIQLVLLPFRGLGALFEEIGVSGGMVVKTLGSAGLAARALAGTGFGPIGVAVAAAIPLLAEYTTTFDEATFLIGKYTAEGMKLEEAQRKLNTAWDLGGESLKRVLPGLIEHNLQLAAGAEFAKAFLDAFTGRQAGATLDPFAGLSGEEAGAAIDHLTKLTEGTKDWFRAETEAEKRARELANTRKNAVTAAYAELKALELVKDQLPNYNQLRQAQWDIIRGTTPAIRAAAKAEQEWIDYLIANLPEANRAAQAFLASQRALRGGENAFDYTRSVTGGAMQTSQIDLKGAGHQGDARYAAESVAQKSIEMNNTIVTYAEDAAQRTREAWANGLGSIGGSFIKMAMEGKASFAEMTMAMLKDLALLTLKMAAMRAIAGGGAGAVGGNFLTGVLGALGGGANGFDYVANSNRLQLPGFAGGGSFRVAGTGGTDSKVAMFRVTPGESVHVRTPQQQMMQSQYIRELQMMAAGGGSGEDRTIIIQQSSDPGEVTAAGDTNAGQRVHLRNQRKLFGRRRLG